MTAKQNEKDNQPAETSSTSDSTQADTAAEVTALFRQMLATLQMESTTRPLSEAAQDALDKYDEIRQALATEALTDEQKAVQWPAAVALIHEQFELPTTQSQKGT